MLRTSVVIDYQNVHLTARDVFAPHDDAHLWVIHPMQFARAAIERRNQGQREGYPDAELSRVRVFRGLPHVDHDTDQHRRCQAQADHWRASGAHVELKDLKYRHQRGADGRPVTDIHGKKIPQGRGREKGIDVLCALACVREADRPDIDLVILASRDTDLVPALDEVYDLHGASPDRWARIETVSWKGDAESRSFGHLRPSPPRRIWNTNLDRRVAEASLDREDYT